jgi:hypothetical protein
MGRDVCGRGMAAAGTNHCATFSWGNGTLHASPPIDGQAGRAGLPCLCASLSRQIAAELQYGGVPAAPLALHALVFCFLPFSLPSSSYSSLLRIPIVPAELSWYRFHGVTGRPWRMGGVVFLVVWRISSLRFDWTGLDRAPLPDEFMFV